MIKRWKTNPTIKAPSFVFCFLIAAIRRWKRMKNLILLPVGKQRNFSCLFRIADKCRAEFSYENLPMAFRDLETKFRELTKFLIIKYFPLSAFDANCNTIKFDNSKFHSLLVAKKHLIFLRFPITIEKNPSNVMQKKKLFNSELICLRNCNCDYWNF